MKNVELYKAQKGYGDYLDIIIKSVQAIQAEKTKNDFKHAKFELVSRDFEDKKLFPTFQSFINLYVSDNPEYVKELVTHHVGGYLKIAPEHTAEGPLSKMMKPGMGAYDEFKVMFDRYSKMAGKEQFLIPYFIAAHPGTTDNDMMNLALWLKRNGYKADQVQTFYPSPLANATAMYHTGKDPLHRISRDSTDIPIPKGDRQRRLHKAFLRYHDPNNWPVIRDALKQMGRADLIGFGKQHLIPPRQPIQVGAKVSTEATTRAKSTTRKPKPGTILTQHTGLPPRQQGPKSNSKPVKGKKGPRS
jgi:hypothetical protein